MKKYINSLMTSLGIKNRLFCGSSKYWEQRYRSGGNSGAGSYNRLAEFKAEVLNDFCKKNGVRNVIEFGCGDGNQLSLAQYESYIGLDVSAAAVEICRERFVKDPTKSFEWLGNTDLTQERFRCELALSLDVIFHLVETAVFETYIKSLFNASDKYVIIYSSDYDRREAAHVRHHRFTDFVERDITEFKLSEVVKNRYPFDPAAPDDTSFADFYIYTRNGTEPPRL